MSEVMEFPCPHCGFIYQLDDEYLSQYGGRSTACTQCAKDFELPGPTQTPAVQVAAEAPLLAYAAPAYPPAEFKGGAWRDRGMAVVTRGGRLPPRCVRCNVPVEGRSIWMRLKWTPQIYTGVREASHIARFALAEEVMLRIYLCPDHRRGHLRAMRAGWQMPLVGICAVVMGPVLGINFGVGAAIVGTLCIGGFLIALVGFFWRSAAKDFLRVAAVEPRFAWITGCHPAFVESLPELAQASAAADVAAGARLEQIGETSESDE